MLVKTLRRFLVLFMAGLGGVFWSFPGVMASPPSQIEASASSFIQSMGGEVISYISDPALSREQRKQKLEETLDRNFDTYTIGRFTLGRYWQRLNPEQQKEYLALYKDMIVSMYADRFSNYEGQTFEVSGVQSMDTADFGVRSFIVPKRQEKILVDWRVRLRDDQFKIVDVAIEGVSMIITQKDDFSSAIQRKGGDPSVILDYLREKTGKKQAT